MSNHAYLDVFVTGYQGHVIQIRVRNWLITSCGINEFANEHSNTSSSERCWDKLKFIDGKCSSNLENVILFSVIRITVK